MEGLPGAAAPCKDMGQCPVPRVAWSGAGEESTPVLFTRPRASPFALAPMRLVVSTEA